MADDKPQTKATKTGRTGKRGIPKVDKTQDYDFFIDEYTYPDAKKHMIGHAKMANQTNNALTRIAPELKISKLMIIRKCIESYVKYHDEAKAIGGERFFQAESSFEGWMSERKEITKLLNQMIEKNTMMQNNSKSPESQLISQKNLMLAKMINLTHKNVL